jgi:hypothetical protein
MDDAVTDSTMVSNVSNYITDVLDEVLRQDIDSVFLRPDDAPLFRTGFAEVTVPGFTEKLSQAEFDDVLESLDISPDADRPVMWTHHSDYFAPETFVIKDSLHLRSLNGNLSSLRFDRVRLWRFTPYVPGKR